MSIHVAYIALGSNLDNPLHQVERAIAALESHPHIEKSRLSSWYRNTAVSDEIQPDYINGVVKVATTLKPHALLDIMLDIERQQGRRRLATSYRNAPRTIDLDLLLYENRTINTSTLTVPHPRMTERDFVLLPLLEIAPHVCLPCGTLLSDYKETACALRKTVTADTPISVR